MSNILLRNYQKEALESVNKSFDDKITTQLIVLPTGTGKTVILAAIAKHFNKKTLILAHRDELIQQTKKILKLYWPEADIGISKAELHEINHQIVIGSVQSCSRRKRLEQLKKENFELLIIDEAHHSTADSYKKIIKALGFAGNKNKLLVGVTATPERSDKKGLGDIFKKIVFTRSISTMIKASFLSPVFGRKILTKISLQSVKLHKGDFECMALAEAINTDERNKLIVKKYKEHASTRKGIAFCVDVDHCKKLAAEFCHQGISAAAVWGSMDEDSRKKTLAQFTNNEIQVLTSCAVLTEGYDEPSVNCIAMCRPTKSKGLYTQCIGRGLRPFPSKQDCLVLDFSDDSHNIDDVITLSKTIPYAQVIDEGKIQTCATIENLSNLEKASPTVISDELFDLFGNKRFAWIKLDGNEYSLLDDYSNEMVVTPKDDGFIAHLYKRDGNIVTIVTSPLPFEYCIGTCEDYVRNNMDAQYSDVSSTWNKSALSETPTKKQIDFLNKHNAYLDGMNKRDASFAIKKVIALQNRDRRLNKSNPLTERQRKFLEKYGIDHSNMTMQLATKVISQFKQAGSR